MEYAEKIGSEPPGFLRRGRKEVVNPLGLWLGHPALYKVQRQFSVPSWSLVYSRAGSVNSEKWNDRARPGLMSTVRVI